MGWRMYLVREKNDSHVLPAFGYMGRRPQLRSKDRKPMVEKNGAEERLRIYPIALARLELAAFVSARLLPSAWHEEAG